MTSSIAALHASDLSGNAALSTVQATRLAGATTIDVDTVSGWPTNFFGTMGTPHSFTDPITGETLTVISEATAVDFKGHVDTGNLIIDTIAPGYTDAGSTAGDIVILKPTTQYADNLAAILATSFNDDGTPGNAMITGRTEDTSPDITADYLLTYDASASALKKVKPQNLGGGIAGWIRNALPAISSVAYNGNRSYNITFASSVASILSAGMRLRTTRTSAAPTQCTSLNGSTQYWSKSSPANMAQTDSITEMAWVKLTSYAQGGIISRNNGTTDGWKFYVNSSGQVILAGARAADDLVTSAQSLPLTKWIQVAGNINTTTTTGIIYFDGVSVPVTYTNNANTGFATPTQSLLIGATNGASPTDFFPGKIAQAALFNAVISAGTIQGYIAQGLVGTETSLISAYSFNGNGNDLNSNANHLTANGSAVATNADSPYGGQSDGTISSTLDYAVVTKVATTVATVQVPEGCTIPTTGGVSSVDFAMSGVPYLFPRQTDKWDVEAILKTDSTQSSATSATWYNVGSFQLNVPIGSWQLGHQASIAVSDGTNGPSMTTSLSTGASSNSDDRFTTRIGLASTNNTVYGMANRSNGVSLAAATPYYLVHRANTGFNTCNLIVRGATEGAAVIRASLAF